VIWVEELVGIAHLFGSLVLVSVQKSCCFFFTFFLFSFSLLQTRALLLFPLTFHLCGALGGFRQTQKMEESEMQTYSSLCENYVSFHPKANPCLFFPPFAFKFPDTFALTFWVFPVCYYLYLFFFRFIFFFPFFLFFLILIFF
jgi:hypothetical protein